MKDFFFGFEHSLLLWTALPAAVLLLLLYLLHRRSKTRVVPAIFLWDRPEASPNSGSRLQFRLPPPLFYLELAILLLLTAALAAPFVSTPETFPPLAVVLDASMSMQAKLPGGKSPLESGTAFLKSELKGLPSRRVVWILAGESPELASDGDGRTDFTAFWTADASSSDLAAAASLARRVARGCHLLIVTDREPGFELAPDTTCYAAGAPLPNSAIVNARRTSGRLLIEAANFSSQPIDATLALEPGNQRSPLHLDPRETRRVVLAVPGEAAHSAVTIKLENPGANALAVDDSVVLEAEDDSPVTYHIAETFPSSARNALARALDGNPLYRPARTGELPDLDVLPSESESPSPVHLFWYATQAKPAADAESGDLPSASGPLSLEDSAVLTRGLPLDSLQWAVSVYDLPGQTLVRSGSVPAVTMRQNLNRDREIFLNLDPARSNIARHPFWPVFFQNLAQTVRSERFGPARVNLRSGELLRVRLPRGAKELAVTRPDGKSLALPSIRGQVDLRPELHGVWKLASDGADWSVSVMGLSPAESDLAKAGPFRKNADPLAVTPFWMLRPLAWAFLLLAAALLALHHLTVGRKGARS